MSLLLLRLAGSLQSWSGYRHQVNMTSSVPTQGVPRKSAINGLIGTALGPVDHGFGSARDLEAIGDRYRLHVRVEARNATTEDFQVLGPLPPRATTRAEVMGRLGTASTKAFPAKRGDGNFPTTVSRKDFLSHTEFVVGLQTDQETAEAWFAAFRDPVFMPYLGRKSCAPSFPFLLGVHPGEPDQVFATLGHVDKYGAADRDGTVRLTGYEISGDYNRHVADLHPLAYSPPTSTRESQLTWVKEHCSR